MGGLPDLGALFQGLLMIIFLLVPLAIWKVIDIIIWLFQHITISWG